MATMPAGHPPRPVIETNIRIVPCEGSRSHDPSPPSSGMAKAAGVVLMGRRKVHKCRICKKRPVWRGGDVKNPGPFCKHCYHKHVWAAGGRSGRKAAPEEISGPVGGIPSATSSAWLEIESTYWRASIHEPIAGDPEATDGDEAIPF
jgi:hypothetical protein